jgi:hypothetical protein
LNIPRFGKAKLDKKKTSNDSDEKPSSSLVEEREPSSSPVARKACAGLWEILTF